MLSRKYKKGEDPKEMVLWYAQQLLPSGGFQCAHPLAPTSLTADRLAGAEKCDRFGE